LPGVERRPDSQHVEQTGVVGESERVLRDVAEASPLAVELLVGIADAKRP
jgi:hypothetical protein